MIKSETSYSQLQKQSLRFYFPKVNDLIKISDFLQKVNTEKPM